MTRNENWVNNLLVDLIQSVPHVCSGQRVPVLELSLILEFVEVTLCMIEHQHKVNDFMIIAGFQYLFDLLIINHRRHTCFMRILVGN